MEYPVISADSHLVEAGDAFTRYIDPKYRDSAPRLIDDEDGVTCVIEGMKPIKKIGVTFIAGVPIEERTKRFGLNEIHNSGWDPTLRVRDQERDGISAEVLYPSVGLVLANHADMDYKVACFSAYNRWSADYCAHDPVRFLGIGQIAMRTPEEGIEEIHAIKALGLRGVLMPGIPGVEDYNSPIYDKFWATAAELDLPLSWHVVAVGGLQLEPRGHKLNTAMNTLRGLQDLMGMLVFCGVFERNPNLRVVSVEGDAGWLPHYLHKVDRSYREYRHFLGGKLPKMPSEYYKEHIYLTFQDDPNAWRSADLLNWRRLMWASDFPHTDATFPYSRETVADHSRYVSPQQTQDILCNNVAGLYKIDLSELVNQPAPEPMRVAA